MTNCSKHFERFILTTHSARRFRSFAIGATIASERGSVLSDGATYEMLNYLDEMPTIDYREYYLNVNIAFWSFAIGFRIKEETAT